jgi:hypothetical protein
VSISGDYAIVGAYGDDDNGNESGSAYIFERTGIEWSQKAKLTPDDGATDDHFGYSVSISGDYAIVGAYGDDDNGNDSGSAYIFERMGIEWSQKAKLTPDDGATDDHFGYSVSISGDYAIVGAPLDDDNGYNSGSAYVFQKPLDSWTDMTETAKLTASDGYGHHDPYVPVSDNFGRSVNISENYAIVGAYGLFRDGSAYIFKQPVGGWEDMTETAKLTPSDEDTILEVPNFGRSVCISGVFAVVGADNNSFGSHAYDGAAYVFQQPLDGWTDMTETAKLKASDGSSTFQNDFGFSVCISGDYLIAGARLDDENGSESGSAYIFKQPVGGWENMTETAKLIARDSVSGDHFGGSVSMSGDYVIIGASGNESAYIYFIGNFQPKISIINNIIINENTQTDSISFTVLDSETLPEDLLITGISSNNILVPNENIVFEGTDVNRTLTITPVPNEVGATTITVTLSDGMDTVSESFLFTVLDTDGDDLLNMGQTTIDHDWKTINLSSTLQNAIYILSPPTYHGTDPGVVRLQNVTNNSFDIRFQEWLYKDGSHTQENIPYLVISGGRHQMANGSIWEAGTFSLSGTGAWNVQSFSQSFPSTPALFLTAQTYNGPDPITVRARNVTNTGFEAALFEEENKMDGHATEEVGYLAVYSPQLSGTVNINGTDVPYLLQAQSVDHRFVPVLSSDIKLEEEQSKDIEINHINETISILALGDKIFTQDMSSNGGDTTAIRRLAPEYNAAMEWGTVDGVDHNWMKIPLAKEYMNPVVVAKPVSSRGGDPGVIRIRNICHNSFELRYNEWAYKDGLHVQERVFYMVVEAGIRSVAGLTVEARKLNSSKLLADGWESITFSASFSQTPSVFTSVQTYNGADPVTTRLSNCTFAGFDLTMDEEEAIRNGGHTTENIGWIAIEKGTGNTNDNRSVVVLSDSTSDIATQINFGQSMARRFPVVVSDMITTYGGDPCFLRYQNLLPSSIDLFIQEEQSADSEMTHTTEDVSLFVAE